MTCSDVSTNYLAIHTDRCCICLSQDVSAKMDMLGHWRSTDPEILVPDACPHACCKGCINEYIKSMLDRNMSQEKISCPQCRSKEWLSITQRQAYIPTPEQKSALPGLLIIESGISIASGAIVGFGNSLLNQEEEDSTSLEKGLYATALVAAGTIIPTLAYQAISYMRHTGCRAISEKLKSSVAQFFSSPPESTPPLLTLR